jgi:hypothetical protein
MRKMMIKMIKIIDSVSHPHLAAWIGTTKSTANSANAAIAEIRFMRNWQSECQLFPSDGVNGGKFVKGTTTNIANSVFFPTIRQIALLYLLS